MRFDDFYNSSNKVLLGTCQDENLVEDIFGSTSEFARQVEENGDDFIYGNILVKYNPNKDIHYFWKIEK